MTEQKKRQDLHKAVLFWGFIVCIIGSILLVAGFFAILLSPLSGLVKYFLLLLVMGMGIAATTTLATFISDRKSVTTNKKEN